MRDLDGIKGMRFGVLYSLLGGKGVVIRVFIVMWFEVVIGCIFLRGCVRKEGGVKNIFCNVLIRMGKI